MTSSGQGEPSPLLLDTRALILLLGGVEEEVAQSARKVAEEAQAAGGLRLCDVSLFELAQLEERGELIFSVPLLSWVEQALDTPGLSLERLTPALAAEAARLPGGQTMGPGVGTGAGTGPGAGDRDAGVGAAAGRQEGGNPGAGLSMIDRIVAATARVQRLPLLAGSRSLASYGNAGYLSIVPLR